MNRYCPACHRTEELNSSTLTPDRTTCPRDFFQLVEAEIEDPIESIFGGKFKTEMCLLPGKLHSIFKVVEPSTGKKAMVSVLSANETDASRLMKFVEKWSTIRHTNVLPVTTYGASPDKNYIYVVSEHPEGAALTHMLDEHGNIAVDVSVQLFLQLCDALEKIGAAGIVHGNVMPAHIYHVEDSEMPHHIRISCDAALTRFLNTPPGAVSELSPLYLGLEFVTGDREDITTDVYSLGCAMYATLTGIPPFSGKTFEELKESHETVQPLPLRGAAPDVDIPGMFDKVVLRTLRKTPAERFPNTGALKAELLSAAEKSRIYLPTYMNATYNPQTYTGDTGAYQTQRDASEYLRPQGGPSGEAPQTQQQGEHVAPEEVEKLLPESRFELESKVKDLRSHVYLVTTIAIAVIIGLAAILMYEGPAEDRAPAWKKLLWTMSMSNGDGALTGKKLDEAKSEYTKALDLANFIQDGGDRKAKTLRKLRVVHEQMHDKKGAEKIREEVIKFDQQRLKQDEAPVK